MRTLTDLLVSSLKAMARAVCNKTHFLSLAVFEVFAVVSEDVTSVEVVYLGDGALLLIALSQID